MRVGLISDTHGLLRPEALAALRGCDHLIHAGDIGGPELLDALRAIAPLTVVRGNNDTAMWTQAIPETQRLDLEGVRILVIHDAKAFDAASSAGEIDVLIAGHSHRPLVEQRGGLLWINPGSAGPRRFRLPVSVAELVVGAGQARARIIELDVAPAANTHKARVARSR